MLARPSFFCSPTRALASPFFFCGQDGHQARFLSFSSRYFLQERGQKVTKSLFPSMDVRLYEVERLVSSGHFSVVLPANLVFGWVASMERRCARITSHSVSSAGWPRRALANVAISIRIRRLDGAIQRTHPIEQLQMLTRTTTKACIYQIGAAKQGAKGENQSSDGPEKQEKRRNASCHVH